MHIKVNTAKPYSVMVEKGLLRRAGEVIAPFCHTGLAAIVTDATVDALHGKTFEAALHAAGLRTVKFVIPAGEASKNGQTLLQLLEFLAAHTLSRSDVILAFGGGVVGDLAGFAAAIYLRGIPFLQIPTTLLAMVDSSVGGKTAIDLAAGKNLAGAFYQPCGVLCDPLLLETLPAPVFQDGCAEVIKYGVIGNRPLFASLQADGEAFDKERVITACISMKRDIVEQDEFDTGERQLLNFGHTFGHAAEKISAFSLSHGRAVAIGMVMMARCAAAAGLCESSVPPAIASLCRAFGLPTDTEISSDAILNVLLSDKKRKGDTITLAVPKEIGHCILHSMPISHLQDFLECGRKERL